MSRDHVEVARARKQRVLRVLRVRPITGENLAMVSTAVVPATVLYIVRHGDRFDYGTGMKVIVA